VVIHEHYFMISSLSWHSSNKFDSAHLTNSEIRVKKQNKKKSCVYMERAVYNQLTLLYNSSNSH